MRFLQKVNTTHENYEIETKQPIIDRIEVIDMLTRPRTLEKNSFDFKHFIPHIHDEQWLTFARLFKVPPRSNELIQTALREGRLPLSPLANSSVFRFSLKPYEHPFERLVTDVMTID